MPDSTDHEISNGSMPFLKHLEELRKVLLISLGFVGVASIVSFFFVDRFLPIIIRPVHDLGLKLVFTRVTEGLFFKFNLALIAGLVLSFPVILWQIWRFMVPALYPQERRYIIRLVPISILLFVGGVVFAYFTVFRVAVIFLIRFAGEFQPMLTISDYLRFTLSFLIPSGIIFEFPLVIYFLTKIGLITPELLVKKRRYSIVIAFVVAAIITPTPDPINQTIMAAPMIVLYEAGIIVARIVSRKKQAKQLAEEEG